MPTAAKPPASTRAYPEGGTFGQLLDWHLWWGTRPEYSHTRKNPRWPFVDFAQTIHIGVPATESGDTPAKKLRDWRRGRHLPDNDTIVDNIFEQLFGADTNLAHWKRDLEQALYSERKARSARGRNEAFDEDSDSSFATPGYKRFRLLNGHEAAIANELGIRRDLLEVLAMRFGHESPDDSDGSLLRFLKKKAREYHELKARIDDFLKNEMQLGNLLAAAQGALDEGNFAEAEEMLSTVEILYQEDKTLIAIKAQSEIRITRGDAALLSGPIKNGFLHYSIAASFFSPFSKDYELDLRISLANRILAKIHSTDKYQYAVELLEPMLNKFEVGSIEWANLRYHIGCCLCFAGADAASHVYQYAIGAKAAIVRFNEALSVINSNNNPTLWSYIKKRSAMAMSILGQCEIDAGEKDNGLALLENSLALCEKAKLHIDPHEHFRDWRDINYLSMDILIIMSDERPNRAEIYLRMCIDALRDSFSYSYIEEDFSYWVSITIRYAKIAIMLVEFVPTEEAESLYKEVKNITERGRWVREKEVIYGDILSNNMIKSVQIELEYLKNAANIT